MHGTMHDRMMRMMQGGQQGMHGGMRHGMMGTQSGAAGQPTMVGQEAFGAIQEVVQVLEADPTTDWSKVNIAALREHLIDMNEVTLRAVATEQARRPHRFRNVGSEECEVVSACAPPSF